MSACIVNPAADCPEVPAGGRLMFCTTHSCRKTKHYRDLCRTDQAYRQTWDKGQGPFQPDTPLTEEKRQALAAKQLAILNSIRPIAERLAAETGEPGIVADAIRYHRALIQWERAGFPIRDEEMRTAITETMCPGCCRYQAKTKTCGRCGGNGQLVAVLAWMATARCPGGVWDLW